MNRCAARSRTLCGRFDPDRRRSSTAPRAGARWSSRRRSRRRWDRPDSRFAARDSRPAVRLTDTRSAGAGSWQLGAGSCYMFKDLNEFIAALDKARELARITEPVSPDLEICAVTDRVSKSPGGGPGLVFERPTGYDMPVAINLYGSLSRICMALGVSKLDDLAGEIEELATPKIPSGMVDAIKMLPTVS